MTDFTPVVLTVFIAAMAVALCFIIAWARKNAEKTEQESMLEWVKIAAEVVEQMYRDLSRDEKFKKALEFLAERGIDVNSEDLRAALESALDAVVGALAEEPEKPEETPEPAPEPAPEPEPEPEPDPVPEPEPEPELEG